MASDFLFDYLPSFYGKYFEDENGNNLATPLFSLYEKMYGDAVYKAIQIRQAMNFDRCPFLIHEKYITIDVSVSNKYLNGYRVSDDLIWVGQIYYDSLFTSVDIPFVLMYDSINKIKYVVINNGFQGFIQSFLFVKECYKDLKILNRIYGDLLGLQVDVLSPNNRPALSPIVLDDVMAVYLMYRQKLLAIRYALTMGPTFDVINNAAGIYMLQKFSPVTGFVNGLSNTQISILNEVDQKSVTVNVPSVDSSIVIGGLVKKYDILEPKAFRFYDLYSDPARFTQMMLASIDGTAGTASSMLNRLLKINTAENEDYANLNYDSTLVWDDPNFFWDMGNGFGKPNADGSQTIIPLPGLNLLTNFQNWSDNRFDSKKIYEMFHNVFIVECVNDSYLTNEFITFMERIKPTYTKLVYKLADTTEIIYTVEGALVTTWAGYYQAGG